MSKMKVYIMENGICSGGPKKDLVACDDPKETITFQCYTVLVKHPDGYVLYDAACHTDPERQIPLILDTLSMREEDEPLNRLAQLKVKPEEIKYLVLSHLHPDHWGHIDKFPNAEIIVSDDDFTGTMKAYALGQSPFKKDLEYFIKAGLKWKLIPGDQKTMELMDGVTIYNLGRGHTFGILGLLLDLPKSGKKLLVSDAIYTRENVGPPVRVPGICFDREAWQATLENTIRLAEELKAEIWYGHDLEQFKGMIKSTEGCYE